MTTKEFLRLFWLILKTANKKRVFRAIYLVIFHGKHYCLDELKRYTYGHGKLADARSYYCAVKSCQNATNSCKCGRFYFGVEMPIEHRTINEHEPNDNL